MRAVLSVKLAQDAAAMPDAYTLRIPRPYHDHTRRIPRQPIAGRVVVSCWLSTLQFLNNLNELIFLLVVNPTHLSLHCAI